MAERLGPFDPALGRPLRLIRVEGRRAIVEVPHRLAGRARERFSDAWSVDGGRRISVTTVRTWGTLLGAKAWIRRNSPPG